MSLKNSLCEISKHSLIYMLGWGIAAVIRLGMLPLFTRCLGQQDYGIISILDSSVELLRILCALGFSSAIVRFYNDSTDICFRRTVMATGACFTLLATVFFGFIFFPFSKQISKLILGNGVNVIYFQLAFATILANILRSVADSYLTVNKYSVQYIVINTVQVVLQAALNLYLVVFREFGVTGMLVGNLLIAFVFDVGLYAFVAFKNGFSIDLKVIIPMLKFSLPLVPTVLAAAAMHNLDRFFIKFFASMEDVGLYSLAYQFPFMLNTIFMSSFVRIWESNSIYEIAKSPDASYQYGRICTYFMTILAYVLLVLSVMSDLVMKVFAAPSYFAAHEYIPIISLGVWGYALHTFVRVGVNLSKKTHLFTINYMLTLIYNVVLNLLLVPRWGAFGAAWATVGTYFGFSIGGYIVYRKYNCVNIEWSKLVIVVLLSVFMVIIKYNICISSQLYSVVFDLCLIAFYPMLLFLLVLVTNQPEVVVIKNMYVAIRKYI